MYNILLLGDSKVGKTSLVTRFTSNTFDPDYEPTFRIHHKDKKIKIGEETVIVQVVDTIGLKSEHDLPIISKTIEAADGIFVLFDLTNPKTQEMARFWFNQVRKQKQLLLQRRQTKNWMIVIGVGTKEEGQQLIDQDGVQAFSKQCSAEMFVVSAKTGYNVTECFQTMTKKIIHVQTLRKMQSSIKEGDTKKTKISKKECQIY